MKVEKQVDRYLTAKQSKQLGKAYPEPLINLKTSKYKDPTDVIRRQYSRAEVPTDKLYMIDKVVRMRGLHGRFGIDHSELLNYEIDQTNKGRDDHMNWLVYKGQIAEKENESLSKVLREKLNITSEELATLDSER